MNTIILKIWICLLLPVYIVAQPVINSVQANSSSIPKLNKLELTADITVTYSNPYDYDEIAVQCIFTAPSGRKDTVEGFFMQDYLLSNGNLTATGTGNFKVRYAPNEIGNWTYDINCRNSSGTGHFNTQSFECSVSSDPGFIRKNSSNYLNFDNGAPYFPIGENMGWPSSNVVTDYTNWLGNLTTNGGNFIRVWMASWSFALEWKNNYNGFAGLKKYKQTNAFYFDWLLDYCKQNNVYLMLTLNNHGQVSTGVNPEWTDNPYNAANGGPATNTWDFFTNANAKNLHKNRLRYIIARYGYSQAIQSWELFNEIDWTDQFDSRKTDVKNWHEEMANFIKSKDVYKHLVTTSFAKDVNDAATWNLANIDFTQTHYYIETGNIENTIAAGAQTYLSNFQKPTLNGEFGLGPAGNTLSTYDPNGVHIHNALWGTAFSGALGSGLTWWWDDYIQPRNLYPYFKPLRLLTDGIALMKDNYKKTSASTTGGGTADASIAPGADWGLPPAASFTIDATGNISPAANQLSKYVYGNQYNTQFRKPPTFSVTYPVAGQFKVLTGGSTGTSPKINIYVDGIEVLNSNAAINSTYSVNISAGAHTIKVDNLGTDWFLVSSYVFTSIGSPLSAYVLKSANNAKAAGYVLSNNYNWKYLQNSGGVTPATINGAGIIIPGLQNGPFKIDFYSCSTSALINSFTGNISNGTMNAPLPSIAWDVAFTVSTNFYKFTGNGNWSVASNWSGNAVPPAVLPAGGEIIIDPTATGSCILDAPQTISSGGKISVQANKHFVVNGNLLLQ